MIDCKKDPDNPRETDKLLIALIRAERFDNAYSIFADSIKKYDKAPEYCKRAGKIGL